MVTPGDTDKQSDLLRSVEQSVDSLADAFQRLRAQNKALIAKGKAAQQGNNREARTRIEALIARLKSLE